MHRRSFHKAFLAAALPTTFSAALAQAPTYPLRPVKIVVPLAAGGGVDVIARILAERLSQRLKQPFLVENKPGASTNIGAEYVARAPGDAHTLLLTGSAHTLNPNLFKLRFNPRKDLVPVSHVVNTYQSLVTHPSSGIPSIADLVRAAKARPDHYTYGSAGNGTPSHVAGIVFAKMAGIKLTHIPYKGAGAAATDLLGGQIHLLFSSLASVISQVEAGKMKALGISSAKATPLAPQIPPIAATIPGYEQLTWFGLFASAGSRQAVLDKLSAEIADILRTPEMQRILADNGMEPVGSSPAVFNRMLEAEFDSWPAFLKETPIQME